MAKTEQGTTAPSSATAPIDEFLEEKDVITANDIVPSIVNTQQQSISNNITADDILPPKKTPEFRKPVQSDKRPRANDYRSRFKGVKRPMSLDLSDIMCPPITRRGFATYETLQEAKFDHRVIEGDKAILPPPISLPPTYPLFDRGEEDYMRSTKLMKNVTRSATIMVRNPVSNEMIPQVQEVLEYVEFINGQKQVNIQSEYILYAWLELHPLNETNKWRDKGKKALFRRTDFDHKSTHQQMLHLDLQREAENYVLRLDKASLINLAAGMFNPTIPTANVPVDEIRYNLRLRARNNPEEVLFKSPDKKATPRLNIISALDMGILEYIPEKNAYYLSGDDQPMWEVAIDANPLEDLSGYFASEDGRESYDIVQDFLSFWK